MDDDGYQQNKHSSQDAVPHLFALSRSLPDVVHARRMTRCHAKQIIIYKQISTHQLNPTNQNYDVDTRDRDARLPKAITVLCSFPPDVNTGTHGKRYKPKYTPTRVGWPVARVRLSHSLAYSPHSQSKDRPIKSSDASPAR